MAFKFSNLTSRLGFNKSAKKDTRDELIMILNQLALARKVIEENSEFVKGLAKKDEKIAKLLSTFAGGGFDKIQDKIFAGEEVSQKEAGEALDYLADIKEGIEHLNEDINDDEDIDRLKVPLDEMLDQLKKTVMNDKLDDEVRRDSLAQIQNLVEQSKLQTQSTKDLLQVETANMNFNKDGTDRLDAYLDNLARDTTDVKIEGNLDRMAKTLENLEAKDDKDEDGGGLSLAERFKDGLPPEKAAGILDFIGPLIGLPGLGSLLSEGVGLAGGAVAAGGAVLGKAGKAGRGIGKGVSKGLGKIGGASGAAVKGVGGMLGKSAKMFTSVISKVAPALLSIGAVALKVAAPLAAIATVGYALFNALKPLADLSFDKLFDFFNGDEKKKSEENNDLKFMSSVIARRVGGKQLNADQMNEIAAQMRDRIDSGKSTLKEELMASALHANPEISNEEAERQVDKLLAESTDKSSKISQTVGKIQGFDEETKKLNLAIEAEKDKLTSFQNVVEKSGQSVASAFGYGEEPTSLAQDLKQVETTAKADPSSFLDKYDSFEAMKNLNTQEGSKSAMEGLKGLISAQMGMFQGIKNSIDQNQKNNSGVDRVTEIGDPSLLMQNGNM